MGKGVTAGRPLRAPAGRAQDLPPVARDVIRMGFNIVKQVAWRVRKLNVQDDEIRIVCVPPYPVHKKAQIVKQRCEAEYGESTFVAIVAGAGNRPAGCDSET